MAVESDSGPHQIIAAALRQGEQVVWHGRPAQGVRVYPADYLLFAFVAIWFGVLAAVAAAGRGDPVAILLPSLLALSALGSVRTHSTGTGNAEPRCGTP